MPPCVSCGGKWQTVGGGLCFICRTVDRLSGIIRQPHLPTEWEAELLRHLRIWICTVQDIGELSRGVVPQAALRASINPPLGGESANSPPETPPPGAVAKSTGRGED